MLNSFNYLVLAAFLFSCSGNNEKRSIAKNTDPDSLNRPEGYQIEHSPSGQLKSKREIENGKKVGEWYSFQKKRPKEASLAIFQSDSLIASGFINWFDDSLNHVQVKKLKYIGPDSCEKEWGYSNEGHLVYYRSNWYGRENDTLLNLFENGDTGLFFVEFNDSIIKQIVSNEEAN